MMTAKRPKRAALRQPWRRRAPAAAAEPEIAITEPDPDEAATIQVFAHGLIADLFGAGLRIQNIAGRASEELQVELEDVADQIDKAIQELRSFAFQQRA